MILPLLDRPGSSFYNYNLGIFGSTGTFLTKCLPVSFMCWTSSNENSGGTFTPNILQSSLFIILLLVLLVYFLKYFNGFNLNKIIYFKKELIFVLLLALLSIFFPSFQFYLSTALSGLTLFITLPYIDKFFPYREKMLYFILAFLNYIGVSAYMEKLLIGFFGHSDIPFFRNCITLYASCILYVLVSRILFVGQIQISDLNYFWFIIIYLCLFIGLMSMYLRVMLSSSLIIYNLSQNMLLMGDDVPPPTSEPTTPKNVTINNYNNRYVGLDLRKISKEAPHLPRNSGFYRGAGLCVSFLTLGIAGYAALEQRRQTSLSEMQNHELRRQNDLEEVEQGFLSKEEYLRRYPRK